MNDEHGKSFGQMEYNKCLDGSGNEFDRRENDILETSNLDCHVCFSKLSTCCCLIEDIAKRNRQRYLKKKKEV